MYHGFLWIPCNALIHCYDLFGHAVLIQASRLVLELLDQIGQLDLEPLFENKKLFWEF
jgi:hypothetical protein